jgi:hypothetical protein
MTVGIEVQLRRDLRDIAQRTQPESIRPLRVPPPRHPSRTVRWLAPVAAAVTVAALIAGLTVAGQTPSQLPSSQPVPSGMPKYYVSIATITHHRVTVLAATVHASATGAAVAITLLPSYKADLPPFQEWIAATASDRLFVIRDPLGVYALRLAANGHPEPTSKLPVKLIFGSAETEFPGVLSPNGRLLALAAGACIPHDGCRSGIAVVSLATGASRKWLTPGLQSDTYPMNWSGNGRELLVAHGNGYRLLNVAGAGGSLLAYSVPIPSPARQRGWSAVLGQAMLTPDGRSLISADFQAVPVRRGLPEARERILEFSARSGRLVRVLRVAGPARILPFYPIQSLGPAGLNALVQCIGLGRLDGSHFTPLPGGLAGYLATAW